MTRESDRRTSLNMPDDLVDPPVVKNRIPRDRRMFRDPAPSWVVAAFLAAVLIGLSAFFYFTHRWS